MRIGVPSEALRYEPPWTVSLLELHCDKLEGHEGDDEHRCDQVRLLVQEVLSVHLEVQWHEGLHGEEGHGKLHGWALATPVDVSVSDLRDPERRIEY